MSQVLIIDLDDVDEEGELVKQTIDDHHDKLELSSPVNRGP